MRRKIGRLISLVVLIFSLNIVVCQASTESHISPIDENKYMIIEDSFDRGLWSGISTRIKASINQIFNNNDGTIYEDLQIKYITIDGKRLNLDEMKKNPTLLKDAFLNRDNSKGLQNIDITSINQDKYSYSRYLNLIQQDVQPLQIALNTTWTKEKGPYYITGEVQVLKGATLTIEEGTTVYFNNIAPNKNKSGILVDGKLKIEGTENEPVRLLPRSESRSEGSWKGIYVTERGTLDVEYAKIEGAGSWTGSAIYTLGDAKLNHIEINNTLGNGITAFKNIEIQNSIIKNNSGYGVDLYRYLKDYKTIVTDNVFTNNQSVGRIVIRDTKSTQYDVTNNDTINNGMDNIILGGAIVGKMGFTNPGEDSGYQIINTHAVNGEMDKFSISKNSEVSFNNTQININTNTKSISDSEIDINGKLMINNSLITNGDYDNWYGLYVSDTGELVINNSHLTNAIKPIFSKGKVTLNQSKIKNTLSGIYSEGDLVSLDSEFKNIRSSAFKSYTFNKKTNLIINNTKFSDIQGSIGDVYVSQSGGNIKFSNVKTDEKVKENFIHLSGSLSESTDFDNIGDGIPYVISDLSILKDATVNFNAGSILKIENGVYFGYKSGIDVYGELNLNGTSNNRVSVTSFRDDRIGGDSNGDGKNSIASAGDWGSINYHASNKNRNSQITYTDILYGGDHREGYALGGEGSFNIQSSKVANSSEAGIGVLGTIVIQDSILEENRGYGVYVRSRDNFNLIMNRNYFKDNQDYATLVEFDSTFNHIEMSGNEASNNKINGVGLTGTILSDLELSPAGTNFQYVIPNNLAIEEDITLTLNPNTVVKYDANSQLDVKGHLNIQGSNTNKVYFTSLLDDSIDQQDTNNDSNLSEPYIGAWKGIVYYPESEGTFNNFECIYSTLNMDYSKIPYLKAIAKGDDSVAISGTKAAYIKSINGIDRVYMYDFKTRKESLVSSSDSPKASVSLDGSTVAWIENKREVIVKLANGSFNKYEGDYVYLGENHIVVRDGVSNSYGEIGDSILTQVYDVNNILTDSTFKPVISDKYLFYKGTNSQLYKMDLASQESYYVISDANSHRKVSLDNDTIAMVSSQSIEAKPQIYVNKIDNWNTVQTTLDDQNTIKDISLLGDKLLYFRDGKYKQLIIQSSTGPNIFKNISIFTENYNINSMDIGSHSVAFSDDSLIYLVKTTIESNNTSFVKTDNAHPGYEQNTYQTKGGSIGFGAEVKVKPDGSFTTLNTGIDINSANSVGVKYILNKNKDNQYQGVGLDRESSTQWALGVEAGFKIGLGDLFAVKGSLGPSSSSTSLRSDRYIFGYNPESYRQLGILYAQILTEAKSELKDGDLYEILERKLNLLNISEENLIEVRNETGKGFNTSFSGQVGIGSEVSAGRLKLSGNLGLDLNISNSNMVKVGIEKGEEGEYKFASYYSSLSGDFKTGVLNVKGEIDSSIDLTEKLCIDFPITRDEFDKCDDSIDILELNGIPSSWSDSFIYNLPMTNTVLSPTVRDDGTLVIPITTTYNNSNGYTITTIYKIKNILEHNTSSLFKGLDELYRAIKVLDSSEAKDLSFNASGLLSGYINDLFKFIESGGEVGYETYIHKITDEYNVNGFVGRYETNNKTKIGATYNTTLQDELYVLIAKGNTLNIGENAKYTAYIPVSNEDAKDNMDKIVAAIDAVNEPTSLRYLGGQLALNVENINMKIIAPSFTNLHKSTFITAPLSIDGKEIELPTEGQYLIKDSVYFNTIDEHNQPVNDYPENSQIKFYLGNSWDDNLENNYAIFKYDNLERAWIKLGGRIDASEKSISLELNESGQYAVGYDKNQPKIVFKNNNQELNDASSNHCVNLNDYIDIEIFDDLPLSEVTLKVIENGEVITTNSYHSSIVNYRIDGEPGKNYKLVISYKDRFGNLITDWIGYQINEIVTDQEEEQLLNENIEGVADEYRNEEEVNSDVIEGTMPDDVEGGLTEEENREEVNNQEQINLPSNKDELESE